MIGARTMAGALVLTALAGAAGCAAGAAGPDRTGGLSLAIESVEGAGTAVTYRVEPDGTIEFAGGRAALNGETTWSGVLTDEEIAELRRLVEEAALFERAPDATGGPADRTTLVTLRDGRRRARHDFVGRSPQLEPIETLLDRAARRRLTPVLDTLPRPNATEAQPTTGGAR